MAGTEAGQRTSPSHALSSIRGEFGTDVTVLEEGQDSGSLIEIAAGPAETIAEQLAGWGARIEVVSPDDIRERLARIGQELVERYASR